MPDAIGAQAALEGMLKDEIVRMYQEGADLSQSIVNDPKLWAS